MIKRTRCKQQRVLFADIKPEGRENYISLMAACAAARRAMGTRKGEQDT